MMTEDRPEEPKVRRDTRAPLVAPVAVEYSVDGSTESTYTANMTLDGLFVLTSSPKPVGTEVRFELAIQRDAPPIKGFGEVRWIRVRDEGRGQPAGMGLLIRLMVGEEGGQILREAIAGAIEASGAAGSPVPAPALDLASADAKQALLRARPPAPPPEGAPTGPEARGMAGPQARKFEYGMHAQRAAELRSQRRSKRSDSTVDQLRSKLGSSSGIYRLLLLALLLLLILVIFLVF